MKNLFKNSLQFQLDDIPFPTNTDTMPVYERLLNFGLSLYVFIHALTLRKLKQELQRKNAIKQDQENNFTPDITPSAKNIKRNGTIDQILQQRQHEYNARKEELQKEREQKELSVLKSPRINNVSRNMSRSDQPAHERLFELRKQSLAKREVLQNKLREDELKQVSGKPKINKQSKHLNRGLQSIMQWEKEKIEKAESTRALIQEEQEKQMQHNPKINPISERLARQTRKASKVEDHLLLVHEKKKMELQLKIQEEKEKQQQSSQPLISVHSAQLQRSEPVFDRLYNVSIENEQRKRAQKEVVDQKLKNNVDPSTGKKMYVPQINQRSKQLQRQEAIQDVLYKKHLEKEEKLKKLVEQEERQMQDFQQPKTSAYSQFLVDLMERRTNTTGIDRLTRQLDRTTSYVPQEEESFTPRINPHSRMLDNKLAGGAARESLLMKKGDEYKEHIQKLKAQKEAEELNDCTFSPRGAPPPNAGNMDFNERANEWARRREMRIEHVRRKEENRGMEECTFQPNTTQRISNLNSSLLRNTSQLNESVNKKRLNDSVLSNRSFTPPPQRKGGSYSEFAKSRFDTRSMTPPPTMINKREAPVPQKEPSPEKIVNKIVAQIAPRTQSASPVEAKKPARKSVPGKSTIQQSQSPARSISASKSRNKILTPGRNIERKPLGQSNQIETLPVTVQKKKQEPPPQKPVSEPKNAVNESKRANTITRFIDDEGLNGDSEEILNQQIDINELKQRLQKQLQMSGYSAKPQTSYKSNGGGTMYQNWTSPESSTFSNTSMDDLLDETNTLNQLNAYRERKNAF